MKLVGQADSRITKNMEEPNSNTTAAKKVTGRNESGTYYLQALWVTSESGNGTSQGTSG